MFRTIPSKILTLEQLNAPKIFADLSLKPRGLVLVTGPTGSGKSTTLAAMIDWELATIGDPLIDLAWFTNKVRDEDHPDLIDADALYNIANMPTRQELARYYSAGTGRDMARFDYYCALALFKGGCILEYKVAQSAAGILPPETGRFFDRLVLANFAMGEALCRKAG